MFSNDTIQKINNKKPYFVDKDSGEDVIENFVLKEKYYYKDSTNFLTLKKMKMFMNYI